MSRNLANLKAYRAKYRDENRQRINEYHRKWRAEHPGKHREYNARYAKKHPGYWKKKREAKIAKNPNYDRDLNRKLRTDALNAYGNKCACCGEMAIEFLSIDHINGGGSKHRRELGGGSHFYHWLKKNGYPAGFRVLCHNCNQALGLYGYCPHGNIQREY